MIQISVDTRRAVVTNKETLTAGSAGIQVEFTLSEDWDSLAKLAVFRVGDDGTKVDVALGSSLTCVVPPEVLTQEDEVLFIGIYGANGQGTVIIPTVWASAGVVKPGTEPETPASAEPTPEIWAQILSVANDAEQTATEAMSIVEDAVNHTPIIQDGYWYFWNEDAQEYQSTGIKAEGTDGYSPAVTIADITGGHRVTITDEDHPQGQAFNVMDGTDGEDGDDGYSPAVTITEITGGHRVTITDQTHPTGQSFDVMDGQDGASDAGEVTYDKTATYQSGSVGYELSSQNNAIDTKAPAIINTASGDIASFVDGADGMQIKKIVGTIVPVQSGTGDPSPVNERPISGWTGANVYNEETYDASATPKLTINWQSSAGTIYGGTVTLNEDGSADVVADRGQVNVTNYAVASVSAYGYYYARLLCSQYLASDISKYNCNIAPIRSGTSPSSISGLTIGVVGNAGSTQVFFHCYIPSDMVDYDPEGSTSLLDCIKRDLPIANWQIVAPMVTPQTYHFDNIGELYTYIGTNNVWIDTGAITECDYPADTKLYVDGLTEPDEDMIANANIASGKYFVVNNQLYISTAAIAAGASIIPGTNCTATNLAEALNALNT